MFSISKDRGVVAGQKVPILQSDERSREKYLMLPKLCRGTVVQMKKRKLVLNPGVICYDKIQSSTK